MRGAGGEAMVTRARDVVRFEVDEVYYLTSIIFTSSCMRPADISGGDGG
jgi:hypothetical protein